jgi:hypothetical protein
VWNVARRNYQLSNRCRRQDKLEQGKDRTGRDIIVGCAGMDKPGKFVVIRDRCIALEAPEHSSDKSEHAARRSVKRERYNASHCHQAAADDAKVAGHKGIAALAVIIEFAVRVIRRGAACHPSTL